MPNVNMTILVGHLTKDPELKYTASGKPVCNISLAVNRKYKKDDEWKKETTFINKIKLWGKPGEYATEHYKKGDPVLVQGELKTESWEKDGNKKYELIVIANSVSSLKPKEKSEDQE